MKYRKVDSKGRIMLGKSACDGVSGFTLTRLDGGTLILVPMVEMPRTEIPKEMRQ